MADLGTAIEFVLSFTLIMGPIVIILRLLAQQDVTALVMPPTILGVEPSPPEEETPPRWRPELIRRRDSSTAVHAVARTRGPS